MIRAMHEPTPLDLAIELASDDIAREYEALSDMQDLGAVVPGSGEGSLLEVAGELALVRDELEELALLEGREGFPAAPGATARSPHELAARYDGLDVDALDALAHWDEEAESRALPDDLVERAGEYLGG
jgi:hypothetical protein